MITKGADLLFEFKECTFYTETVTVKTDDCSGVQFQAGTGKDALLSAIFYQDKPQFLVQCLSERSISPSVIITNQRKAAFLEKQDSKEHKTLSIKFNMAYGQPPNDMVK